MAEERAEAGDQRRVGAGKCVATQHRGRALEHVAEQCRRGEPLAAGAQHIGGADIAGADGADVAARRQRA